ncbi:ABC transporter ATP-binding protein [Paenibacillus lautus]|uniref:ABC transporter ATP-binding protein n=1 Tax=Paenibacillus lautus TaxID=1401 RepID=UPI003D274362
MIDNFAICIEHVSKSFKIYHDKSVTLKEKMLRLRSSNFTNFNAVNDVSLSINKGETVGLIGHNGCGKSTLLKLITKILYPDKGILKVNGRISSLIELGAGFHPDFTGRENIYTNASIFGLSRKEIDSKIDDIIEFSELGDFIENPVRTYSSGMYMRLAFSVAINVDPEILLIDEILSVGDANFQKKCFDKIESFKQNGATILIVAHDLGTIENICDRVVWMDKGRIVTQGEPDRVVDLYTQHMNMKFVEQRQKDFNKEKQPIDIKNNNGNASSSAQNIDAPPLNSEEPQQGEDIRWGSKEVEIIEARIINSKGGSTNVIQAGEQVTLEIDYKVNNEQSEYIFGVGIYTSDKNLIYGNNTEIGRIKLSSIDSQGCVRFVIRECNLLSGKYKLNVAVVDGRHRALDFIKYYMDFSVVSNDKAIGIFSIDHYWEIK